MCIFSNNDYIVPLHHGHYHKIQGGKTRATAYIHSCLSTHSLYLITKTTEDKISLYDGYINGSRLCADCEVDNPILLCISHTLYHGVISSSINESTI